jgi:oligosaccharide reducing-end xylanase
MGCVHSVARRSTLARCLVGLLVACSAPSTFRVPEPSRDEHPSATAGSSGAPGAGGSGGAAGTSANVNAGAGAVGSAGASDNGGSAGSDSTVEPDAGPDPDLDLGLAGTTNLFSALLGVSQQEVDAKLQLAVERAFGIGTGEPNFPVRDGGYRLYYQLPQDPSLAFIWAADSTDIRSEGMSYGMMIAVQMDLRSQYDRLWNFAQTYMQYPADSTLTSWRHYFRWTGSVNTSNALNWVVNYDAETGPAPDGEEYFAAALYLADRRWGSDGAVNYRAAADALTSAMLHNPASEGRTPIINATNDQVVFYPEGGAATFSDPSYHLPAFYELFADAGPAADRARWQQIAEVSRQYLVGAAHPVTGLHPDYAGFDGTPTAFGGSHDRFQYDAWRVVMNMAIDGAWVGPDARMQTQVEKYHAFFATRLQGSNVENSLFTLDGSVASGNGSTALTATLAAGALVSGAANRAAYVQNLWDIGQQSGPYRYYQETVYLLGLLSTSGHYAQRWP